jgi:hypothetical protein
MFMGEARKTINKPSWMQEMLSKTQIIQIIGMGGVVLHVFKKYRQNNDVRIFIHAILHTRSNIVDVVGVVR